MQKIERGWSFQSGIEKKLHQFVNGTLPRHFTIYMKYEFQSNTYQAHHSWTPPIDFTSSPKTTKKCYKSVSLCYARNCWIVYFSKYNSAEGFKTSIQCFWNSFWDKCHAFIYMDMKIQLKTRACTMMMQLDWASSVVSWAYFPPSSQQASFWCPGVFYLHPETSHLIGLQAYSAKKHIANRV